MEQYIAMRLSEPKEKLECGSSRLFGNPDVLPGFAWPTAEENGEHFDMDFIGQINCSVACHYDNTGLLPKQGVLYFFYDIEGQTNRIPGSAAVCYCPENDDALHELVPLDSETGIAIGMKPLEVGLKASEDLTSAELAPSVLPVLHFLCATPSSYLLGGGRSAIRLQLLRLSGFTYDGRKLQFPEGMELCYYISPDALRNLDFSDVVVEYTPAKLRGI